MRIILSMCALLVCGAFTPAFAGSDCHAEKAKTVSTECESKCSSKCDKAEKAKMVATKSDCGSKCEKSAKAAKMVSAKSDCDSECESKCSKKAKMVSAKEDCGKDCDTECKKECSDEAKMVATKSDCGSKCEKSAKAAKMVSAKSDCGSECESKCSKKAKMVSAKEDCGKDCNTECKKECSDEAKMVATKSDCGSKCEKSAKAAKMVSAKSECSKGDCHGCPSKKMKKSINLVVANMDSESTMNRAYQTFDKMPAALVDDACPQTNCFKVKYDAKEISREDVLSAVKNSGLKVTGEMVSFKVANMTCGGCSKTLRAALAKLEGVQSVEKVCHASGHAVVIIDPEVTTKDKVAGFLNATKFKVAALATVAPSQG